MTILTPEQARAARSLLKLTREEVAEEAGVSFSTVRRFEQGLRPPVQPHLVRRIRNALEDMGVVFIDADETRGPGVHLRTASV